MTNSKEMVYAVITIHSSMSTYATYELMHLYDPQGSTTLVTQV